MPNRGGIVEDSWKIHRNELLLTLRRAFGHENFRGNQEEAMREIFSGNDTLVVMPTGGGKSLCYQLPAVATEGICIVVSPLIALTEDQLRGLREKRIPAESLTSSSSSKARAAKVMAELKQVSDGDSGSGETGEGLCGGGDAKAGGRAGGGIGLRGRTKLLYVTPEMLVKSGRLASALEALACRGMVNLLAIDEAHCVSTWGHDFRPAYRKIGSFRKKRLKGVPCIALTATATKEVCDDIMNQLGMTKRTRVLKSSFNRPEIHLSVRYKDAMESGGPLKDLVQFLKERKGQSGIVYCHKRETAERLADSLNRALQEEDVAGSPFKAFLAMPYHGKMNDAERSETQAKFMSGEADVITGSVAFGMGIDKRDVRFVVHWDLPKSVEGLYQELGRAGRDGSPAISLVYHSQEAAGLHSFLARKPRPVADKTSESDKEAARRRQEQAALRATKAVEAVVSYCESPGCRRKALLAHFGEGTAATAGRKGKGSSCDGGGSGGKVGDVCRGTCDWCGGDRERVKKDLIKLTAARAGRGWMGKGIRGVRGEEEGGWDAKSYYRLAGDNGGGEGEEGSDADQGIGSSGDEFDGDFDARRPGAVERGISLPQGADVSMGIFQKEEDYWDRLERLEAEAEGKPSRMASLLGGRLSQKSLKPRAKMDPPKIRSLQQPLLSRSKRKPDRRPSVVGSPAAAPRPGSGSAQRTVRRNHREDAHQETRDGKSADAPRAATAMSGRGGVGVREACAPGKKSPRQAGRQAVTAPTPSVQRTQTRVQRRQEVAAAPSAPVEHKQSSGSVSDLLLQILNPRGTIRESSGGNSGSGKTPPAYTDTSGGSRPKAPRQRISPVARVVSGSEKPGRRPEGREAQGKDRLGVKQRAKMAGSAGASGSDGSASGDSFKQDLKRIKVSVSSEGGMSGAIAGAAPPSGNVSAGPGARMIPRQRSRLPGNLGTYSVDGLRASSISKQGGSREGDADPSGKRGYRALSMTSSVGSSVIAASSYDPDRRQTRPLVFDAGPGSRSFAEGATAGPVSSRAPVPTAKSGDAKRDGPSGQGQGSGRRAD